MNAQGNPLFPEEWSWRFVWRVSSLSYQMILCSFEPSHQWWSLYPRECLKCRRSQIYLREKLQLVRNGVWEVIDLFILGLRILGWRERIACFSREKYFSLFEGFKVFIEHACEFTQNTSNWPDIDCTIVFFLQNDEFRGTIPSSGNMNRKSIPHLRSLFFLFTLFILFLFFSHNCTG